MGKTFFSAGGMPEIIIILLFILCSFQAKGQLIANFSADSTEGCELLELSLNNLSLGAVSYFWEVFDESGTLVSSSTLSNPSFFFNGTRCLYCFFNRF